MYEPSSFLLSLRALDLAECGRALDELERYLASHGQIEDAFERKHAHQWLTQCIALLYASEDEMLIAKASALLAQLSGTSAEPARKALYEFELADAMGNTYPVELCLRSETLVGDLTGVKIWPAGRHLARCIMRDPGRFHLGADAHSILELGSGTGVVGIAVAASLFARRIFHTVTLSDNDEFVLANLRRNLADNAHLWTKNMTETLHLEWRDTPTLPAGRRWDRIVGGDLIYDMHHASLLRHVIEQRLMSTGIAYIMIALRPTHEQELAQIDVVFDKTCPLALSRHEIEEVDSEPYTYQLLDIRWKKSALSRPFVA